MVPPKALSLTPYILIYIPPYLALSLLNPHFPIICMPTLPNSSISIIPKNFTIAISNHEITIASISSWMTANLLNPSKAELIGLPQQLSKIHNPSLFGGSIQPISSIFLLATLASYSIPLFPSSNNCRHYPAPVTTTFVISLDTLDFKPLL